MNRTKKIIKVSRLNIIGNLLLSAFKFAVGIVTNSVSITMDAVNNLSDSMSSLITIIAARLSLKEPNRKHPFGYGRIEYLASLLIGAAIVLAGWGALRESFERIIKPQEINYTPTAFAVMIVAIFAKIGMGIYTWKRGERLESGSLIATGKDSMNDSFETLLAVIAGVIYVTADIRVEAYVGLLISALILKIGLETVAETVHTLLGERVPENIRSDIKQSVLTFPEVNDVFGIVVHNYGKERLSGSIHIEVADALRASWIDNLQRAIVQKVRSDTGVEIEGVTIFATNRKSEEATSIHEAVQSVAEGYPEINGIHGFYFDETDRAVRFCVSVDIDAKNKNEVLDSMQEKISSMYPDLEISMEPEFTDTEE